MKIAFHSNQLGLRGTEVALYDYAKYNEEILGNESIIIAKDSSIWKYSHPLAIKKFKDRFKVYQYTDFSKVDDILEDENVDILYCIKAGRKDGVISKKVKTVVHTVFQHNQPHGDVYAYVSEWLGNKYNSPFVPHMVDLPNIDDDLRNDLNIPEDAIVFGRHGGLETFDIPFAHTAIKESLDKNENIYYLFMFTDKFINHPRVIFLNGNQNLDYKVKFINTCDAMIHARKVGETFGLSVAEFSIRNKPIITFGGNQRETAHLDILKDKAIKYFNKNDLLNILVNFKPNSEKDWNAYRDFCPSKIMQQFKKIFID